MSYNNKSEILTIHTLEKDIHFQRIQPGLYYQYLTPGKGVIFMVHTVETNAEVFCNEKVTDKK